MSSILKGLWLPLLAMALTACGGSSNNNNSGSNTPTVTAVKVVPVSADAPLLSVLVDLDQDDDVVGERLADQAFGQAVIFGARPAEMLLTVRYSVPDGAGPGRKLEQALTPFELDVEEDVRYEVFLGGSYPDLEHWVSTAPLAFTEAATQARLTLTNASPNLAAMDFHLTAVGAPADSSTLVANLNYKETDHSIRVDAGDYEVKITEAGSFTAVYSSPKLSFAAGGDLSLVAIDNAWIKDGLTGKPPVVLTRYGRSGTSNLLFSADTGADFRAVHASPDAGALDVAMDDNFDTPFAEDMVLGEVTPYSTFDAGVYNLKVLPANTNEAGIDTNFNLINGVSWTMFAMKPWENVDPLFISDNSRKIGAHSRLRVVHGSSAAGLVNVYVTEQGADLAEEDAEGDPLHIPAGDIGLKNVSGYLSIGPGTYDLTFTRTIAGSDGAPVVVYGPVAVTLANGEVYTLLLRDAADQTTVTHTWLDGNPEVEAAP